MSVRSTSPTPTPNFFLVGASRAGTSSMWIYLTEHPDIFMPSRAMAEKEPCHFCETTPRWALAYRDRDRYLSLFAGAGSRKAVGEASTPYLVAPEVPRRIRGEFADAKIIIMLRNPVERAFSLYRYLCLIGAEWMSPFERALDVETDRMTDERFHKNNLLWPWLYFYYHSGLYSAQVERYLETFPRDQVEIILFDDLQRDLVRTAQRVYRFLGVDDTFAPRVERYNESNFPLSIRFQYLIARGVDRSAEGRLGPVRKKMLRTNIRLGQHLARPFRAETRQRLLDGYRDDIARTAKLIGRPLDTWLEPHGA